jgi:hypothetical protein
VETRSEFKEHKLKKWPTGLAEITMGETADMKKFLDENFLLSQ